MNNESIFISDIFKEIKEGLQADSLEKTHLNLSSKFQPPHALDAERGILCSLLINQDAFETVNLECLRASDFYHPTHAIIFNAMHNLHQEHHPINTITVVDELIKMQKLDQVGGPVFIAQLETLFPTSAHISIYTKLVKDKSILRKLITAATKIVQSSYRQDRKVFDVIDEAERIILQIRDEISQKGIMPIQELVNIALSRLESMYNNKTHLVGISSGFVDFDRITSGLQPGELIVIAARPSMGKTAFTLNIASHVAMNSKIPVAFFSLEMGSEQLVHRLIGAEAQLDLTDLKRGVIQRDEFAQLVAAAGHLGEALLYIDESPILSIFEMRNKCRRLALRNNIKLVIIDYLQLMTGSDTYENKASEVAEISRGLKSIARELKIPVIALSQLNRGVESRTDKRPMMSDLRESGAIEQDADIIAFLYREEYYLRDKTPENKIGIAEVIIAKNRNGPTGQFELRFLSNITKFINVDNSDIIN